MYNNNLTNCWITYSVTLGHSSRRLLVRCDTLSNYLEKLRMVLKTKHITEHCSHLTFKIHSKRTAFSWRRIADRYSHKNKPVLYNWCPPCGPQAHFNPRHLTMHTVEPFIPCDSNKHQPHKNLEYINSFSISNHKMWNFYGVRRAIILVYRTRQLRNLNEACKNVAWQQTTPLCNLH